MTLYGDMNVMDCYVAIKDMMQHMISTQHILPSLDVDVNPNFTTVLKNHVESYTPTYQLYPIISP